MEARRRRRRRQVSAHCSRPSCLLLLLFQNAVPVARMFASASSSSSSSSLRRPKAPFASSRLRPNPWRRRCRHCRSRRTSWLQPAGVCGRAKLARLATRQANRQPPPSWQFCFAREETQQTGGLRGSPACLPAGEPYVALTSLPPLLPLPLLLVACCARRQTGRLLLVVDWLLHSLVMNERAPMLAGRVAVGALLWAHR